MHEACAARDQESNFNECIMWSDKENYMSNGILESTPRIHWTTATYFLGYTIWHNQSQLVQLLNISTLKPSMMNYSVTHSHLQLPPPSYIVEPSIWHTKVFIRQWNVTHTHVYVLLLNIVLPPEVGICIKGIQECQDRLKYCCIQKL